MTETTCHQCGARNPIHSKYCNRCGASFASDTTHLCPTCDTPNPINLLYCDNCGTRLVDDESPEEERGGNSDASSGSRSEPFSLPARPPGQTGNLDVSAELPDWLKTGEFSTADREDETEEEDPRWLRAAQEGEVWEDEQAPTLEDLSRGHAPKDDLPTWLLDEDTAGTIFSGEKSTDELFMASLTGEDDEPPGESESVQQDELPEWLQGLSAADAEAALSDGLADILGRDRAKESLPTEQADSDLEAAQLSAASEGDAEDELQSWLTELEAIESTGEGAEQREATPDESEVSDETTAFSNMQFSLTEEDDFLQWLSDIQEEAALDEDIGTIDAATESPDADSAPVWLEESQLDTFLEGDEEDEPQPQDSDAPDWLTNLDAEGESNEPYDRSPPSSVRAPDWLLDPAEDKEEQNEMVGSASLDRHGPEEEAESAVVDLGEDVSAGDETRAESTPAEGLQEDEFLQWLESLDRRLDSSGAASAEATSANLETSAAADSRSEEFEFSEADFALPEWLGEFTEPKPETGPFEGAEVEHLPVWLQDLAPPGGDVSLPYVSGTEAEQAEVPEQEDSSEAFVGSRERDLAPNELESIEDGLPEWLSGVTAELEEQSEDRGTLQLGDPQVSQDDLPDWFTDVLDDIESIEDLQRSAPSSTELASVPAQLAGSELPNWLDSPFVDEEAAEPTPLEEIPEWLRAPLKERLARAAEERGLDEATLDSGDEWRELLEAPSTSDDTRERSVHDYVPAWLASLRSSSTRDSVDVDESRSEADEGEGPVAGIQGTIGVAPIIAQPTRRDYQPSASTSGEQEQQIMLLRQLTRTPYEEMSVPAPITSAGRSMPLLTRVLLSALLLASVLLGLFVSDVTSSAGSEAAATTDESIMPELLGAGRDRTVLVVFDYTPAMAGVLQPWAERVLNRLEAQNSHALITSQSPSGLTLAASALEANTASSSVDLGLIPGGAFGVRRMGFCIQPGASCESLYGQPLTTETAELLATTSSVVLITADRDSLTAWIEQLYGTESVTLGAIITPALEPVAAPYVASGQLTEVTVADGSSGGVGAFDQRSTGTAMVLSRLLVMLSLVVGAAFYLVTGFFGSRRA